MSLQQLQQMLEASDIPFTAEQKAVRVQVKGRYGRVYETVFSAFNENGLLSECIEFSYDLEHVPLEKVANLCKELGTIASQNVTVGWFPELNKFRLAGMIAAEQAVAELRQMSRTGDLVSPLFDALAAGQDIDRQLIRLAFSEPTTDKWS